MNQYITGSVIKSLRESKNLTQAQIAERLNVSSKAVSKWETGKGYPDITLIEPIAEALGISVIELLEGNQVKNSNMSFNMKNIKIYVCPICKNVIISTGEAVISCCGITLPALEAEPADNEHILSLDVVEDEYFVNSNHPMTKEHYISFFAAVSDNDVQLVKLYPEGPAQARFKINRTKAIYYYCNRNGLFETRI